MNAPFMRPPMGMPPMMGMAPFMGQRNSFIIPLPEPSEPYCEIENNTVYVNNLNEKIRISGIPTINIIRWGEGRVEKFIEEKVFQIWYSIGYYG